MTKEDKKPVVDQKLRIRETNENKVSSKLNKGMFKWMGGVCMGLFVLLLVLNYLITDTTNENNVVNETENKTVVNKTVDVDANRITSADGNFTFILPNSWHAEDPVSLITTLRNNTNITDIDIISYYEPGFSKQEKVFELWNSQIVKYRKNNKYTIVENYNEPLNSTAVYYIKSYSETRENKTYVYDIYFEVESRPYQINFSIKGTENDTQYSNATLTTCDDIIKTIRKK